MSSFVGWRRFLTCFLLGFFLLHQLSVLELRPNPPSDFSKKNRVKFDHLILGPATGQGLPNRLQCRGVEALNKTHFANSYWPRTGNVISFVTVFTLYNASPSNLVDQRSSRSVVVGNVSYSKLERSMAILNVFINFIQVAMPKSNVIVLTDPASDLRLRRDMVTVYPIPGDYSREHLMLQRIKSYIAFLEQRLQQHSLSLSTHYIFTDSDMAVVDDLEQIFEGYHNFHVALTFRNNKEQPLNSGFIAVRGTRDSIERALKFLREVYDVYKSKYMNASRMLGDQLALARVVKSGTSFDVRRFTKTQAFTEVVGDTSVLFLPCSTYNWTPPEGAGQFHGMPLDVKVVHFKGSRKRLMLEAWNFFNSSADISDMLCLILRSGRTKYDF